MSPQPLASGVYCLATPDRLGSATAGWVALGDHALLIDAPHPAVLEKIFAQVLETTGKPIRKVVLTHGRERQLEAARALLAKGIAVLAHPDVAGALRKGDGGLPIDGRIEAVEGRLAMDGGGNDIEILALGHAAGPGNLAVWLRKPGILFAGEVCANGPRADLSRGNTPRWIHALRQLGELGAKTVVPGHGTVGGPEVIQRQQDYLVELRRQMAYLVCQGMALDDARAKIQIPAPFLCWKPYDDPSPQDIDHVYGELAVPRAPYELQPFEEGDRRPRALALIGDRIHYPETVEEPLFRALDSAGVAVRFCHDARGLSARNLEAVRLFVILRDGFKAAKGPDAYESWIAPDQERAVVEFVERGGGLLALHNSTGIYPAGGPYLEVLGGAFNGHGPLERFRVRVTDPRHPVAREVSAFEVADEQHTPSFDPKKVRVLLESRSEEGVVGAAGWSREIEGGRVCYLANGHTRESLEHPMVQRLLRNAARWCLRLDR